MKSETYEGIEIDRCPACKGMFLDRGELKGMIAKKMGNTADTLFFSVTSDQMDELTGLCPHCNREMTAMKGPGEVRVDVCQGCGGAFLDQGELATLQLYSS
jgi:Zn-finger nucleic acid-binding protein